VSDRRGRRPALPDSDAADRRRSLRRTTLAVLGDDARFDQLLPPDLQRLSRAHFTPVAVARRAAALLVSKADDCVLDVGAGVGKFCLVAAVHATGGVFVGVEQRPRLVSIASELARQFEIPNVAFSTANAVEIDWSSFDAFYFYNPFVEHYAVGMTPLDRTIETGPAHLFFYVRFVRQRLAAAKIGTRVVTYHGFGAAPPRGYVRTADERIGSGRLALWVKTHESPGLRDDDEPLEETVRD
jgi:SAM-dependent methyltransferase